MILLIVIVAVAGFFISSAILLGLSKLFKISNASYRKSMLVVLLSGIGSSITGIVFSLIGLGVIAQILSVIAGYLILSSLFKKYYQASWGKSLGVYVANIVVGVIIALVVAVPIRLFVIEPFVVSGQSMSPHLNQGAYLFIEKFDKNIQRDNVIVFKSSNSQAYLIKRVIGLPSEKITLKDGQLSINGSLFQDQYVANPISGDANANLGSDEYFVMSDNSAPSLDSRTFGPVRLSDIVGKVLGQ